MAPGCKYRGKRGALAVLSACLAALGLMPAAALGRPGALDRSFGEGGRVVTMTALGGRSWLDADVHAAPGPKGTIVAAVGKTVFRYLPDGRLDPGFGDGGRLTIEDPRGLPFSLHDLAVDDQGRIVLAGAVEMPGEILVSYIGPFIHGPLAAVIRYSPDGELDPSFGEGAGYVITELDQPPLNSYYDKAATSAEQVIVGSEGKVTLIGGVGRYTTGIRSEFRMSPRLIVRLTPDGRLDPSFGGDGVISETGLDALSAVVPYGGKLLAGGRSASRPKVPWREALTRLTRDGSIDNSFGHDGCFPLFAPPLNGVAVDRFRRIVAVGSRRVLRLTPRGTRDRRFGRRGGTTVWLPGKSDLSEVSIERSSGRILLAGTQAIAKRQPETPIRERRYRRSFTVIGLNTHGRPDRRFGRRGWVATRFGKRSSALADDAFIDSSGRLVVTGTVARPDLAPTGGIALARYRLGR